MVAVKNRTGLKSLDRITLDPRCRDAYRDSDGIWVNLSSGFNFEGQSAIRGDTIRNILDDWRRVEAGDPY